MLKLHESALTYCTEQEKGLLAECDAKFFFIGYGYEVSKPENPGSPYDLLVRNPMTGTTWRVQVKLLKSDGTLKTYSSGAGRDKGGKRQRISYAKAGIDWIIGVDVITGHIYAYPIQFFENKLTINVHKMPSYSIPFITERGQKKFRKDEEISTLDLLCS